MRWLLEDVAPIAYGFIYSRVAGRSETADDLIQDVLFDGLRSSPSFRGEGSAVAWIMTIARRRLARHWDAERKAEQLETELAGERPAPDPESTDERDAILRALSTLPATQQQVLVLKYLDDRPVKEIAAELERSEVQIQSLLQRARANLRNALEDKQ